jgi:archaemetzincin
MGGPGRYLPKSTEDMKFIRIVAVGHPDAGLVDAAAVALTREFGIPCRVAPGSLDPAFAFHPERNQYHSTMILESLAKFGRDEVAPREDDLTLGIAGVDLYIPILTFVFGEAKMGAGRALVSYHRLLQEFYGLPRDNALVAARTAKEAVHEAGHATGLTHCDDYQCVMAASHSVEWLDLKGTAFCVECRASLTTTNLIIH